MYRKFCVILNAIMDAVKILLDSAIMVYLFLFLPIKEIIDGNIITGIVIIIGVMIFYLFSNSFFKVSVKRGEEDKAKNPHNYTPEVQAKKNFRLLALTAILIAMWYLTTTTTHHAGEPHTTIETVTLITILILAGASLPLFALVIKDLIRDIFFVS